MTSKEVADKLGITVSALNQNISGNPSVKVLNRISEAISVPMWQLFASPCDVIQKEDDNCITCPNCGKKFRMED